MPNAGMGGRGEHLSMSGMSEGGGHKPDSGRADASEVGELGRHPLAGSARGSLECRVIGGKGMPLAGG